MNYYKTTDVDFYFISYVLLRIIEVQLAVIWSHDDLECSNSWWMRSWWEEVRNYWKIDIPHSVSPVYDACAYPSI